MRRSNLFAAGDGRGAVNSFATERRSWRRRASVEQKLKKQTDSTCHRARLDLLQSFLRYSLGQDYFLACDYFLGRDSGGTNPDKR